MRALRKGESSKSVSACTLDNDHWLCEAQRVPSPHFCERPAGEKVELIVIHCISLPRGSEDIESIHGLFLGTLDTSAHESFSDLEGLKVSSHLLIDRQGNSYQYVPFDKAAWHAGESTWRGKTHCNNFSIGIELQGTDDQAFEEAQYITLVETLRTLVAHYPRLGAQSVAGHCHIAPGRKTDPGTKFDWKRVSHELRSTGHQA